MRVKVKFFVLLLAIACVITGCAQNTERDKALQAIREQASRYDFLNEGRNACYTLTKMLGYYDEATYQQAKGTAQVSQEIANTYFPSVNWEGSLLFVEPKTCSIDNLLVQSISDSSIVYLIQVRLSYTDKESQKVWYRATYSVNSEMIISLEELCSYY